MNQGDGVSHVTFDQRTLRRGFKLEKSTFKATMPIKVLYIYMFFIDFNQSPTTPRNRHFTLLEDNTMEHEKEA